MVPASVPVLLAAAWTLLPSGAESDVAEVAFLKGSCLTGMLLPRNGEADMTVAVWCSAQPYSKNRRRCLGRRQLSKKRSPGSRRLKRAVATIHDSNAVASPAQGPMFRRLRTKALLFVRARSNTTKTAFNNMPKPAWDSTNHDLSVHRISRAEVEARRQRLTSPNALAAKAELERRRALLARGSFEQTLAALADESGEAHDALRELDVVERDLRRLGDDAQTMRPPTAPSRCKSQRRPRRRRRPPSSPRCPTRHGPRCGRTLSMPRAPSTRPPSRPARLSSTSTRRLPSSASAPASGSPTLTRRSSRSRQSRRRRPLQRSRRLRLQSRRRVLRSKRRPPRAQSRRHRHLLPPLPPPRAPPRRQSPAPPANRRRRPRGVRRWASARPPRAASAAPQPAGSAPRADRRREASRVCRGEACSRRARPRAHAARVRRPLEPRRRVRGGDWHGAASGW